MLCEGALKSAPFVFLGDRLKGNRLKRNQSYCEHRQLPGFARPGQPRTAVTTLHHSKSAVRAEISVASQLRTLAAWNLRVKSLLLMRLPYAAEAGFGMTPTVLWRASSEHEEGKGQEQGDGEKIRE